MQVKKTHHILMCNWHLLNTLRWIQLYPISSIWSHSYHVLLEVKVHSHGKQFMWEEFALLNMSLVSGGSESYMLRHFQMYNSSGHEQCQWQTQKHDEGQTTRMLWYDARPAQKKLCAIDGNWWINSRYFVFAPFRFSLGTVHVQGFYLIKESHFRNITLCFLSFQVYAVYFGHPMNRDTV